MKAVTCLNRLARGGLVACLSVLLWACASAPPVRAPAGTVELARQLIGTPYRYGGSDPSGFDCSGLVQYVHARAGLRVPRTTRQQYRAARRVSLSDLRPGDLLFFRRNGRGVSHVGIYEGGGRFIHAPSSGKRVSRATLDNPYWRRRLAGAGRFD